MTVSRSGRRRRKPSDDPTPTAFRPALGVDAQPDPDLSTEQASQSPSPVPTTPIIVLTYAFAGGYHIQRLLEREPNLACTTGTGILAACGQAAAAWENAEGRHNEPMTPLAISSIRSMVTGMLTTILARTGRRRWCETAAADPAAAETFLRVFPGARFLCLHRSCLDAVYTAINGNPWGLSGPGFAPYLTRQPTSMTAALTAWWAAQAGPIVEFEHAHPQSCLRVRYEDLIFNQDSAVAEIRDFLGLLPDSVADDLPKLSEDPDFDGTDIPGCGSAYPAGQVPQGLIDSVNALHAQLGYPLLPANPQTG